MRNKILREFLSDLHKEVIKNEISRRAIEKKIEKDPSLEEFFSKMLIDLSQELDSRMIQIEVTKEMLNETTN